MPKLQRMSSKQLITKLKRLGFEKARQRGSHVVLKRKTKDGIVGCVVPLHSDLAIGTIKGILKQAKLSQEELKNFL